MEITSGIPQGSIRELHVLKVGYAENVAVFAAGNIVEQGQSVKGWREWNR